MTHVFLVRYVFKKSWLYIEYLNKNTIKNFVNPVLVHLAQFAFWQINWGNTTDCLLFLYFSVANALRRACIAETPTIGNFDNVILLIFILLFPFNDFLNYFKKLLLI